MKKMEDDDFERDSKRRKMKRNDDGGTWIGNEQFPFCRTAFPCAFLSESRKVLVFLSSKELRRLPACRKNFASRMLR